MFFGRNKELFGLDIGSSSLKALYLKETKKGFRLEKCGIIHLPPGLIVDGTIIDIDQVAGAIRELVSEHEITIKSVALAVSGPSVIVKKITLPVMTEAELEESLHWEAEQYIPFDIKDVNLDFHVLDSAAVPGEQNSQMDVLLVAVKKDKINEYTSLVEKAGLIPAVVDVEAFTLENMYCLNYDAREGEVVALVNIGASSITINILKGGTSTFTRDVLLGGNRYNEILRKELNLGFEEAEQVKKGERVNGDGEAVSAITARVHSEIASEVMRSFDFFKTTTLHEEINRVFLSGGVAKMKGFSSYLQERLGIPVETVHPFSRIEIDPEKFGEGYITEFSPLAGVGVGLALRRVGDR